MTKSEVFTEDRLFATLDPTTRRLRLPKEQEIIITDTVGFIKNLPKDLLDAFRTTLEELNEADLLLHLIDSSNSEVNEQIDTVEELLRELNLNHIPILTVANKVDLVNPEIVRWLKKQYQAIAISARQPKTLPPLLEAISKTLKVKSPEYSYPAPAQDSSESLPEGQQKSSSPVQPK